MLKYTCKPSVKIKLNIKHPSHIETYKSEYSCDTVEQIKRDVALELKRLYDLSNATKDSELSAELGFKLVHVFEDDTNTYDDTIMRHIHLDHDKTLALLYPNQECDFDEYITDIQHIVDFFNELDEAVLEYKTGSFLYRFDIAQYCKNIAKEMVMEHDENQTFDVYYLFTDIYKSSLSYNVVYKGTKYNGEYPINPSYNESPAERLVYFYNLVQELMNS